MFYVEFTKKLIIFSLFTPRFFIQEFIRVSEMNKDEQREGEGG